MKVFTLSVLPADPSKMPVITKNVIVQGGEDCPHQNGPQVLPIPKGQGGQVRFIASPHLCRSPHGSHLGCWFFIAAAAAAAVAAAASGGTATI